MPHQREEILFLRSIGIKAGALYLAERRGGGSTEALPSVDEVAAAIAPVMDALRGGNEAFRCFERERTRATRQATAERQKRRSRLTVHQGGRSQ